MQLNQRLLWGKEIVLKRSTEISTLPTLEQILVHADSLWKDYMGSDASPAHYPAMIFIAEVIAKKAKISPYIFVRKPGTGKTGDPDAWEDFTSDYQKDGLDFAQVQCKELETALEAEIAAM